MRCVIQRVSKASVSINDAVYSEIKHGLFILLGIELEDTVQDVLWLSNKIYQMRIFEDQNSLMNLSIEEVNGDILLVSQFTLFASTKKGNRPSFIKSAKPDIAIPLYERMIHELRLLSNKEIKTGKFGADMKISLVNDGPVTIIVDSKQRE